MYLFTKKDLFYESHRIIFLRVTFIKLITLYYFFFFSPLLSPQTNKS